VQRTVDRRGLLQRWEEEDVAKKKPLPSLYFAEKCSLDCGEHGECESGHCVCGPNWTGPKCRERKCDARCAEHGVCSNGTCLCTNGKLGLLPRKKPRNAHFTGWNGKHCTLEGCPGNCHGRGQCKTNHLGDWECMCEYGWFGQGCQIEMEQDCSDRLDNDKGECKADNVAFVQYWPLQLFCCGRFQKPLVERREEGESLLERVFQLPLPATIGN